MILNDKHFPVSIMKYLNILFKSSFREGLINNHIPTDYIHFNTVLYTQDKIDSTRYVVQ